MAKNEANPLAKLTPGECDMSLVGGGDYLRRIKICSDLTAEVKERKANVGDFFLTGVKNLGDEVSVVVVAARPHALRLTEGSSKVDAESFDTNDPVFQEIRKEKDANPGQQEPNNMYGYDFLLWLPEEGEFVTIYLCKMALFKSVPAFNAALGKQAVMTPRTERSKKNAKITYVVPALTVSEEQDYTAPDQAAFTRALDLFRNPRRQSAEQTPEASTKPTAKKGGKKGR